MKPVAGVAAFLFALVGCAVANPFDDVLAEYEQADSPGYAVGICKNGKPIYSKGIGLADLKTKRPITPESVFDLASVSKQFTAVAILVLVERGELTLDTPIREVLPEFKVADKKRPVTVSDLLHHVGGLAEYGSSQYDGTEPEFAPFTNEKHLEWLNQNDAVRAPGVKFEYSNSGYILLASIVEAVSGVTFAEFAKENMFEPAGMTSTFAYDGTAKLPASAVKGYKPGKDKWKKSEMLVPVTGDGNIYSNVQDLMKWDRALRSDAIISKELRKKAWRNGVLHNGEPIDAEECGYGLGWMIEAERGVVSHGGGWSGTATYSLYDLTNGYTVFVLCNDEEGNSYALAEALLAAAVEAE